MTDPIKQAIEALEKSEQRHKKIRNALDFIRYGKGQSASDGQALADAWSSLDASITYVTESLSALRSIQPTGEPVVDVEAQNIGNHVKNGWIAHAGNLYSPEDYKIVDVSTPDQSETINALVEALENKGIQDLLDCDCPDSPDDESIGWQGGEDMPATFGDIRRLKQALAQAQREIS